MFALAFALAPARARALRPIPDRFEHLDPRPSNQLMLQATTLSNRAGVNLGYRRAFGRHFSLGASFEYVYPDVGYGHIQALGHTLEATGWISRPWLGVYFSLSFTVGQNFLFGAPSINAVALGGGGSMGWSWDFLDHLNLGIEGGLRRMSTVKQAPPICSRAEQCIMLREEFVPRFALTFGYRF
ncbi:DUF3575 domain-containing protein [Pseudenhygromyxa sp. WMMC2535]|uniref:DUF3575 domain-containing protein n=1 Tax=Pseudenhygromyxa sp. WMMC2535 TaxID=2712867 RepID=UPI0015962B71|nr:DUF3575 domain-containing protein [Pseudenhygromyxa sp. WMMC2535]NVB42362.1 DUF3575 domain-containing protein [Pseudenhygromyxa sp. WMMC2535]